MDRWMLPMLAQPATSIVGYREETWAAEPKMDGWRAIVHTTDNGVRMFNGRNGSEYSGKLPYIEQQLALVLPVDSAVDGELISPLGWGGVQTAMTTNGVHRPSGACPELTLVMFDVLRLNGIDTRGLPWEDRRRLVEQIRAVPNVRTSLVAPPTQEMLELALQTGFEGLVLKRKSSRYVNGRSPAWVKIKPQETAEAKVIGFKPGEGSFAGLVGALEFEMLDTGARSRCSGFDMALRREITANPGQWLGQIIEIKHHGLGKEGKPRHPQFLRRRDDRTPESALCPPVSNRPPRKNPNQEGTVTYKMRNYAAMNDAKLLRCVDELENRRGDAYQRCVDKGGNPAADLAEALRVKTEREL